MEPIFREVHDDFSILIMKNENTFKLFALLNTETILENALELQEYSSATDAIKGATLFPKMYKVAKDEGFKLVDRDFVDKTGFKVWISIALDVNRTPESFRKLINREITA